MKSEVHRTKVIFRHKLLDLIMDVFASIKKVKIHSNQQHTMSSHYLQSAWLLTMEFSKMYGTV